MILLLDHASTQWSQISFTLYTVPITTVHTFNTAKDIIIGKILYGKYLLNNVMPINKELLT